MFLLDIQYLAPVEYYALLAQQGQVAFEYNENYQKGTYRNRCYLAGPNGPARLSIPLESGKHQRKKYRDVTISFEEDWQHIHWQSLCSCYRSSPYFEYYEDRFEAIYTSPSKNLFEFNLSLMDLVLELCDLELDIVQTSAYEKEPATFVDLRSKINPRSQIGEVPRYMQVFEQKTGFLQPVSIVDLLFNKGPASLETLLATDLSLPGSS